MSRRARFAWFWLAAITIVVMTPVASFATGESIGGTLIQRLGDEKLPVEGVTITVSQDGNEIGSGDSGADGKWEVPVPGAGIYKVSLDTSTLPEGVALTDPDKEALSDVKVRDGQSKKVIFPLGEGVVSTVSMYQRVGALFVAGLKLGAIIALSAVGLSLVFGVTGLVNFAHAEMVTLGAIAAYFFHASTLGPRWPLVIAIVPAVLVGAGFGWIQERSLWRPLRNRHTGLVAMMVVSIGLSFALRNLFLIIFGGEPRAYPDFAGQPPIEILGIPMVPKQLLTIVISLVVLAGVGVFLQKSRAGTAMRAVSDDADLAESSGINVNRIILITWTLAGGLAALGGTFFGLNEAVQWDMGFKLLLLIFAAVVLGGLGTAYGAMVGGFIVGVAVEMSTLIFPNELKTAVGLALLIVILLAKPQGLLGTKERIG
ncbi:MAG: branched-chain amino acid ABC transporter permease [Actinomycetota bacterium]|nr:branched-chain amino acid ABC transporter permease [Actinomycetota bacterium]